MEGASPLSSSNEKGSPVSKPTVLIVDDSGTVRHLLRSWLQEADYTVIEASDGIQGLDHLRRSETPLVVVLDYEMPGLDGYEVLQHAVAEHLLPPRFAYVVSSSFQGRFPPAFNDLLRQMGIQLLPKPADRESLLAVTAFVARRLPVPVPER
jgi:CheY-like chemotaxis protein